MSDNEEWFSLSDSDSSSEYYNAFDGSRPYARPELDPKYISYINRRQGLSDWLKKTAEDSAPYGRDSKNDPLYGPVGYEEHNPEWNAIDLDRLHGSVVEQLGQNIGYQFIEPIGEGSFGDVWEVLDIQHNKPMACKVLEIRKFKTYGTLKTAFEAMNREVDVLRGVRHQNIMSFETVFHFPDPRSGFPSLFIFIFMDLCEGSLTDQLKLWKQMNEMQAHNWFHQIGQGLQYLHNRDISHMDIKPMNILIAIIDKRFVYKLCDFGISLLFQPKEANVTTEALGTYAYMAPELFTIWTTLHRWVGRPIHHQTKPCDIYSLGICLGETVFGFESIKGIFSSARTWILKQSSRLGLNPTLTELLLMMTYSDPEWRPTIDDVINHQWFQTIPKHKQ